MARSIHDTWGVLARARRADWGDAGVQRAIVAEMKGNIRRQQAIRRSEQLLRRAGGSPPATVDPDRLPIFVDDTAPHVLHPASEEDIRAVLRRLPPGSLDGLQSIRLCIDGSDVRRGPWVRDPFTGRRRFEIIPGVYQSTILGLYDRESATIWLHGCLCEPGSVAPLGLYFKVSVLKTLLHEVAHHFDLTFRVGRSRWDDDDRDRQEEWAERREAEEGVRIAGPYVRERYPSECADFQAWVEEHGGAAPALQVLIDECDSRLSNLLLQLVRAVRSGRDPRATRIDFARAVHRIGGHAPAKRIIGDVLQDSPDDPGALAVQACIAVCKERDFDLAESLCLRAIAADPGCLDAREVLVRGYAVQEKWERAASACEDALAVIPAGDTVHGKYVLHTLVESRLLLGDASKVTADLARMRAWGPAELSLKADVYELLASSWAKRWEEALVLATRMQMSDRYGEWGHWLRAVQFECAHRLGRPHLAGAFREGRLTALEKHPFTREWARRIRARLEAKGP